MKRIAGRFCLIGIVTFALSSGPVAPRVDAQATTLRITGVSKPLQLTRDDLARMPRTTLKATAHGESNAYSGVSMRALLTRAGVAEGEAVRGAELAKVVVVIGADDYRAAFSIADFDPAFTDRVSLLADTKDGQPLAGNAAPFQLVLDGEKRPARWVRQVVEIHVTSVGPPAK
jgi:DMSO/TMAO reductase YedYZ molybdopterin-dependent catalytic subunit